MNAWLNIAEVLQGLRTEHRRLRFYTLIYVSSSLLFLGLGVAWLGAHWNLYLFVWFWVLFFSCTFIALCFWAWGKIWLPTKSFMYTACLAEALAPQMGTALRSAVDFKKGLDGISFRGSKDLVDGHFRDTAQKLEEINLSKLLHEQRSGEIRLSQIFVGVSLGFCLLIGLFAENGGKHLEKIFFPGQQEEISENPITGNLQVTYKFPAYTRLEPRKVSGSDGHLQALHATEVTLNGLSQFPIMGAFLRFWDVGSTQARHVTAEVIGERGFRTSFSLLYDGYYQFVMVNTNGEHLIEGKSHRVTVTPDAYPSIAMQEPAKNIELKDDESVRLLWTAQDDFAVDEVALIVDHKNGKEANRIVLEKRRGTEISLKGKYKLSVAGLNLGEENEATIYLEVTDNDVINGPKKSTSISRQIKLFSAREQHKALLAEQDALLDALVDGLAGELNGELKSREKQTYAQEKERQQTLLQVLSGLRGQVLTVLSRLNQDKLSRPEQRIALKNIAGRLDVSVHARSKAVKLLESKSAPRLSVVKNLYIKIIQKLEKDIIYFDDLLALRRVENLKETAQELLSSQRELSQLLEEYRNNPNPQMRSELAERIKALRQKMLDLLRRMSSIRKGLPGEYRNLEASRGLEMNS